LISTAISAIDRALTASVAALLIALASGSASAQQAWGQYATPLWGQSGPPRWGQYSGNVGGGGWQYNRTLKSGEPEGAILNPNQAGSSAGPPSIFSHPDTRLLGRNAPP
jgi:hypothetical protein